MTTAFDRRYFLTATSAAFAGLYASGCEAKPRKTRSADPYGPLVTDPNGLLDLPKGFSYRVVSRLGDVMSDGGKGSRCGRWHGLLCPARRQAGAGPQS